MHERVIFIVLKAKRNISEDEIKKLMSQDTLNRYNLQIEKITVLPQQ